MEASAQESKTLLERVRAGLVAIKDWLVIGYSGDTFTYRKSKDHPLVTVVAGRYLSVDPEEVLELARKRGELQALKRYVERHNREVAGRSQTRHVLVVTSEALRFEIRLFGDRVTLPSS